MEQIDVIKRLVAKYNDSMALVTEADGIMQAFNESKIASLICKFLLPIESTHIGLLNCIFVL